MNLPALCIRRPVMTTLLMVAMVIFGVLAYRLLPVSELPNVDFPTISVSASLPGASPETMASAVATPLEGQFSTIAGVDSMSSVSANGSTRITLQFALDRDIDAAAQDVQSAIGAALRTLPSGMPAPPSFRKVNPADSPIFYVAMSSSTMPMPQVSEFAETLLGQRISTIPGVAQVLVYGSQKRAVRLQVDPDRLAATGIGIDEVKLAVQRANVNQPTGSVDGPRQSVAVRTNGQLESASAYEPVIVAYRNGAPVRLADVAQATEGVENNKVANWYNGQRAIVLAVQRQPGSNTVATVDAINKMLPGFAANLPAAIKLDVMYDRSESIRESIHEVEFTLVLAGCLVILVIFLFLRSLSATVIPSLALPISVVGTFGLMYWLGYSLDNLSLLALTLAVGYVVDDAIVMLENIVRHVEAGETPMQAAFKGSKEIGFTIISMTISLIAVFIPVMFMQGIVGRLLHEFAVTICAAILVSALVSLTLTPMLCARFLKPHRVEKHGRLYQSFEDSFNWLQGWYDRTLKLALHHHRWVMASFVLTVIGTVFMFGQVPKDFIPSGDSGRLLVYTEGPQDASFDWMVERQQQVADIVGRDPGIGGVMSVVGAGGSRPTANTGLLFVQLKPHGERKDTPEQIIQRLRPKVGGVVGIKVYMQNPPPIRIGGQASTAQYQYTLQDTDLDQLYSFSEQFLQKLRTVPGFVDVSSNLNLNSPTLALDIQRDKLSPLGLSAEQVEDALASAFSSRQISTIYASTNQYAVILEASPKFQQDPDALSRIHVRASNGRLVPLDTVVTTSRRTQSLTVNHQGQLPSVTLSFNLTPGTSLGEAVNRIKALEAEMKMPASLIGSLQGSAQAFQDSFKGLGLLLLVAVFVVYIVLGVLYESFIHPLTILSGLPSASLGALLTLWAFNMDLNLYGFVGVLMLIGIVKKNAIMMIDFALERQRSEHTPPDVAIYEACLVRFRPIMMTTMAALMGILPIAIGFGAGGEARKALGLAVVGGLILSQIITLYLTPVVYIYLDRLNDLLSFRAPGKRVKTA